MRCAYRGEGLPERLPPSCHRSASQSDLYGVVHLGATHVGLEQCSGVGYRVEESGPAVPPHTTGQGRSISENPSMSPCWSKSVLNVIRGDEYFFLFFCPVFARFPSQCPALCVCVMCNLLLTVFPCVLNRSTAPGN